MFDQATPARKTLLYQFRIAFAYAVKALLLESADIGWSKEELMWPQQILECHKIPGECRILQDRFCRIFQDFFRHLSMEKDGEYWKTMEEIKESIFFSWHDWHS